MTCHIALSNATAAVLFSDSQGSTAVSAFHGWQKQFVGSDFLVGVAGNGNILDALFAELDERARHHILQNATDISTAIRDYLNAAIKDAARPECQLILVTPSLEGLAVQTYDPRTFYHFGRRRAFDSIGSGAEFVFQAMNRNHKLGIEAARTSLADLLVLAEGYADAASESLTVDNRLLVGMLNNGRAYLSGDQEVVPTYGPEPLCQQWNEAARRFASIIHLVRSVNGEIRDAQSLFSAIRTGTLSGTETTALLQRNQNIQVARQLLDQLLTDYFTWYDQLLGRPTP